jgi:hypothetical protein
MNDWTICSGAAYWVLAYVADIEEIFVYET